MLLRGARGPAARPGPPRQVLDDLCSRLWRPSSNPEPRCSLISPLAERAMARSGQPAAFGSQVRRWAAPEPHVAGLPPRMGHAAGPGSGRQAAARARALRRRSLTALIGSAPLVGCACVRDMHSLLRRVAHRPTPHPQQPAQQLARSRQRRVRVSAAAGGEVRGSAQLAAFGVQAVCVTVLLNLLVHAWRSYSACSGGAQA